MGHKASFLYLIYYSSRIAQEDVGYIYILQQKMKHSLFLYYVFLSFYKISSYGHQAAL